MSACFAAADKFPASALLHALLFAALLGLAYWLLRTPALAAIFRRNFTGFFVSPVGYLFVAAFAVAAGEFAFSEEFFAANLADLEQLNMMFPYLACFLVPAITMSAWSEERRSGTEELLLTLPGTDWSVVLGKYFAYLAVYTVALLFTLIHPTIMALKLGEPDYGLLIHNFLGYWSAGAALVACGMAASALTANVTVGYILGAATCLFFVALPKVYEAVGFIVTAGLANLGAIKRADAGTGAFDPNSGFFKEILSDMSVGGSFRMFAQGLTTASAVWYFLAVAAIMLCVNVFLLGRRHWAGGVDAGPKWAHALLRLTALAAIAGAVFVFAKRGNAWLYADGTAERLHTPSPATAKLLSEIPAGTQLFVNAFLPPARECPPELVEVRRDVIDKLQQLRALGGGRVQLNIVEAEKDSKEGDLAEKTFGIRPRAYRFVDGGEQKSTEVIMGVAVQSGNKSAKIDPFTKGMPVEYELVRALRKVGGTGERTLAVMTTDANMISKFGSFGNDDGDWRVVADLGRQVKVVRASPGKLFERDEKDKAIKKDDKGEPKFADEVKDAATLMVPMPSALGPEELDDLVDYIRTGRPVILLEDPMLFAAQGGLGTSAPRPSPGGGGGGPFGGMGGPAPPKGDFNKLLNLCNLEFTANSAMRRTRANPLNRLQSLEEEIFFAGPGLAAEGTFNAEHPLTKNMRAPIAFIVAGGFTERAGDGPKVTKLLTTLNDTPTLDCAQALSMMKFTGRPGKLGRGTDKPKQYALAVLVQGKPAAASLPPAKDAKEKPAEAKDINVLALGDCDFVADQFYQLKEVAARESRDLMFDNLPFFLNCVDFMMGDEGLRELRDKRPARLGLTKFAALADARMAEVRGEVENLQSLQKKDAEAAQKSLDDKVAEAKKKLGERVNTIEGQADIERIRGGEQVRLDARQAELNDEYGAKIRNIVRNASQERRELRSNVRLVARLLPALPVLALGLAVFAFRRARETEGAVRERLVR